MGLFALPNILIFQILLPLVSPLIDLMFVAGVMHYFIDKHFHPETASADSFDKLLGVLPGVPGHRLCCVGAGVCTGAEASGQQGRRMVAVPYLDSALYLSAGFFRRAVQDDEAGDRRQAVQLGQAGPHGARCRRPQKSSLKALRCFDKSRSDFLCCIQWTAHCDLPTSSSDERPLARARIDALWLL